MGTVRYDPDYNSYMMVHHVLELADVVDWLTEHGGVPGIDGYEFYNAMVKVGKFAKEWEEHTAKEILELAGPSYAPDGFSASLNKSRVKLTSSRVGAVASSNTVDRMFDRKIRLGRKA